MVDTMNVRFLTDYSYPSAIPGTPVPLVGNPKGDLSVAQGLPERSELVRLGNSWGAQIVTGSAFTYVAAWPTTRAELVLSNGEQANGKIYLIDRVWMSNITSMAAAQPMTILAQVSPTSAAIAAAANDTTHVFMQQLSGNKSSYGGKGTLAIANTGFAVANHWFPLGSSDLPSMTTNLGASIEAFVYGRLILQPGSTLCLAGLAGTAAGTAILGVEWHEVQLPAA